jgi:hypothetical protein
MRLGIGKISKKWLVTTGFTFYKIDRMISDVSIDGDSFGSVETSTCFGF